MKFSTHLSKSFIHFGIAAIATVVAPVVSVEGALSENIKLTTTALNKEAFTPPGDGAPKQTVGGASRGTCPTGSLNDISFSPTSSLIKATLPAGMAQQVFFSLRDANNQTVYQGFVPVDQTNNTVQISSNQFGSINAQGNYTWSMAIICGRALRPDSPVFQGRL